MSTLPICSHHITPTDAKINLAAAKKVFRQWMLLTGHLDEIELPDHVMYLVDAIKEEESFLKDEIERAKEEIQEELSEIRTQISKDAQQRLLAKMFGALTPKATTALQEAPLTVGGELGPTVRKRCHFLTSMSLAGQPHHQLGPMP
jgi:hypothetical protein